MATHLVFRILGPLELERDGSVLPLRGPKTRGLLALLLLHPEQGLTPETLIDALWGDTPPPTARTSLQMQVSRLRRQIQGDPMVSLASTNAGYVLHLGPDSLDLHVFQRLAEEGRSYMARGEYAAAKQKLEEALSLWRGSPLANVDIPGVSHIEVISIDEMIFTTRADRLEVALALGRHKEAVPELEALRTALPLNERVHALAAIALYRSGRQAEALNLISGLRHRLSGELGIEPGRPIQEIEGRILARDPTLDAPEGTDDVVPRTKRKTVATLVCRLAIDEGTTDPEIGRESLGHAVEGARATIESHGGTTHGVYVDRIDAVFGVPRVHEDDPTRALRAAAELRAAIQVDDSDSSPRIRVRIGVALGELLVESEGGAERLVSVGPIDEADQLARAARPGEILMGSAVARFVGHTAGLEASEVLLLGPGESSVGAFRLLDTIVEKRNTRRFDSPLVGRRQELEVLHQAFARSARDRKPSLITLLGSAGVGKTRLVDEFADKVSEVATVLRGHCLSYGREITFWPIAQMVRQAATVTREDRPGDIRKKIGQVIGLVEDANFIEDQVASAIGLGAEAPSSGETFWAVRRFFELMASARPLVAVFDDIQWADTTLLDLIEYLVMPPRETALLVVCMTRQEIVERRRGWGGGRLDAVNLPLGTLDREDSSTLVDNLVGPVELDDRAKERILEAGEGHPLYLEELVGMFIDSGLLKWSEGRWVAAASLSEVPIPQTVQALIGARIDRLGTADRLLLEEASVIGRDFTSKDLVVFNHNPHRLEAQLDVLESKDLISLRGASTSIGRKFRFRHQIVRDVVYRGISKEARATAHETFGAHLEAAVGRRASEPHEILGYHFETAYKLRSELGQSDPSIRSLASRAASHLWTAGARAFARDDNPAAAGLLRRARDLLEETDTLRCEIGWRLGVALFEIGEFNQAEAALAEALDDASRLGDESVEWRVRLEQTDIGFWRSPGGTTARDTERIALEARAALQRLGDPSGAARALRLLGDALGRRGKTDEAVKAYAEGRALARETGDDREAAQRSSLGVVHGPIPVERCLEFVRANLEIEGRPDPEALAMLGFLLAMATEFDEASRVLEEAVSRASTLGSEWRLASIRMHFGAAMLISQEPGRAETVLRPATQSLQAMGERSMFSTAVALLAESLYQQKRLDEAMQATVESEHATADDDIASQIAWRGVRSKILAANGSLIEAEQLAREGVRFANETDLISMTGDACFDLGIVLLTAGKTSEAQDAFLRASAFFERKGNLASLARAEAVRAALPMRATS